MTHIKKVQVNDGFTLVELLLSMTFISILLISIAMLVIQITNIYNRGITMKEVNQVGRLIQSDIQSGITQSPRFSPVDGGDNYTIQYSGGEVVGARLCTGKFSYIWNKANETVNKYDSAGLNLKFAKAPDPNSGYCIKNASSGNYPDVKRSEASELLNSGENNLSMYSFGVTSNDAVNDDKVGHRLYSLNFTIGTTEEALTDSLDSCRPPDEIKSDINYCSINEFNFVVRAGNQI